MSGVMTSEEKRKINELVEDIGFHVNVEKTERKLQHVYWFWKGSHKENTWVAFSNEISLLCINVINSFWFFFFT